MRVAVRVDANSKIGAGHFFRCLTLVNKLVKSGDFDRSDVLFLSYKLAKPFQQILDENKYTVEHINISSWSEASDIQYCLNQLENTDFIDLVIVDHYQLSSVWEKAISKYCHTLLTIDDLANREHYCDLLLDQTLGRQLDAYQSLVPTHSELILGSDYTLLRDEFVQLREQAIKKRASTIDFENILISLGATDHLNLSSKIITWLNNYFNTNVINPIQTTVVLSSACAHIEELRALRKEFSWLKLVIDTRNMAEHILTADIAIGACGTSSWERCALGLPTLSVITADNQRLVNESLAKRGAIFDLGNVEILTEANFIKQFSALIANPKRYRNAIEQCFDICKANGAAHVLRAINAQSLRLRKATSEDCMQLFQWQSNSEIRKYARNNKPVELDEHIGWFNSVIVNPKRHLYLIEINQTPVGMLRLDELKNSCEYEISILIAPEAQGRRIASRALKSIPKQFSQATLFATVLELNKASHSLFQQAGYKKLNDTTYSYKI